MSSYHADTHNCTTEATVPSCTGSSTRHSQPGTVPVQTLRSTVRGGLPMCVQAPAQKTGGIDKYTTTTVLTLPTPPRGSWAPTPVFLLADFVSRRVVVVER